MSNRCEAPPGRACRPGSFWSHPCSKGEYCEGGNSIRCPEGYYCPTPAEKIQCT